jgi:alpha-glucuronidase
MIQEPGAWRWFEQSGNNENNLPRMTNLEWIAFILLLAAGGAKAEDGYRLWLRYTPVSDPQLLQSYRSLIKGWMVESNTPTGDVVRRELRMGLDGLLGQPVEEVNRPKYDNLVIVGTFTSPILSKLNLQGVHQNIGDEGYVIFRGKYANQNAIFIAGKTERGMLYGAFHFLRLMQAQRQIDAVSVESSPRVKIRILNHWDNLDRTVERGYAGFSLWDWHKLPDYIDPRYYDYARANASIGINGTVLTNVNANALILTPAFLKKVAALADIFRPYGIRVYLTARFSAPMEIGGLKTADPLDPQVRQWWSEKIREIYQYIPDFGGFTVKANSEGQPGPQNYKRTHADGANMLAEPLKLYGGVVMWRAFVYDNDVPVDRTKQAYDEFKPLDGKFQSNVMVQVKNGPLDFQPREPFHPLFGAMPRTPLIMEFQITQEYLGQGTHLVFLAPLFKETLDAATYEKGPGSTVAKVVDGSLESHAISGMAGVSNIGDERNWCGHPFAQANWYAFGRLAWDPTLTSKEIADEWIRMTFTNSHEVVNAIREMMLASREILVEYMTPLGLHHIMGTGHHYGPAPWVDRGRADWTPVYYHRADENGIGFDRSSRGTNALEQYQPQVRALYEDLNKCPEKYLLWFHHVPWDHKMASGRTLWEELCFKYNSGVDSVAWLQQEWSAISGKIDAERFAHVNSLLKIQHKEAKWWRDACLLYFATFSKQPIPPNYEKPGHTLDYYEALRFPYAPGH